MNKDMELTLKLSADGKAMVTAVKKADDALGGLGNSASDADKKIGKTRKGVESISKQLSQTKQQLIGLFAVGKITSFASQTLATMDSIKQMNARLRIATGSQAAFNAAQLQAQQIAREARADYESTVNLFSRLSTAANQYHIEQDKIAATTAAVTYGLKLYGASATEVSAVQIQLSQALASGTLAGDEFKSMAEASPRLMQALADGLGVARSELKKMASDGQLTTEKVITALAEQSAVLKTEYQSMPITVGDAMGQLKNTVVQVIEDFDSASGASENFAHVIMILSNNVGGIASVFAVAAVSATAFYAAQKISVLASAAIHMTGLGVASSATSVQIKGLSIASLRSNSAVLALTSRMKILNTVMRANPIAFVVSAIAAATSAFILFNDETKDAADASFEATNSFDAMSDSLSFSEKMASLNAEGLRIQKAAAEASRKKSVELTAQLKVQAKAHYEAAKAALAQARVEADLALSKVKSAQSLKSNSKNFGAGIFGGKSSANAMNEIAKNTMAAAVKNYKAAVQSRSDALDAIHKAEQSLSSLETQAHTLAHDKGVVLSAQVKAARDAVGAFKNSEKELNDARMAGLLTQAEYTARLSEAKTALGATEGAQRLLAEQNKKTARSHRRGAKATKGTTKATKAAAAALKDLKQQQKALADYRANNAQKLAEYAFETSLIGRQADEIERLRWMRELNNQAQQAKQGLSVANRAAVDAETQSIIAQKNELLALRDVKQQAHDNDWAGGIRAGLASLGKTAGTTFDTMKNATEGAFSSMADGIANFVATGKGNFKSLTASILADMSKMLMKAAMMKMFGSLFGMFFGGGGWSMPGGFGGFGAAANGAAFNHGIQMYANGGIFDKPTAFRHKGGLGVMGEAGPEAVMPLTRGPNGKLGVQVYGKAQQTSDGGMYNDIKISVSIDNGGTQSDVQSQQSQGKQLAESLDAAVQNVLAREMRPGGMLNNGRCVTDI